MTEDEEDEEPPGNKGIFAVYCISLSLYYENTALCKFHLVMEPLTNSHMFRHEIGG